MASNRASKDTDQEKKTQKTSRHKEPAPGSSRRETDGPAEVSVRDSSKSTTVPLAMSVIVQRPTLVTSGAEAKPKEKEKRKHYHGSDLAKLQKKALRVPCTTPRDFQEQALDAHNRFRRVHGVPPLVLDDDLSQVAQAWANQCASSKKMEHSKAAYGENVYFSSGMDVDGSQPVDAWYSEVQKFNFDNIDALPGTGHFTQVVWESTKKLGIALAVGKNKNTYVVAEYDPPGNILGRFKENILPPAH